MPLPVDDILYRVEAVEKLTPGTKEFEARVLFLKAERCAELKGFENCSFCGLWMFCDLVQQVFASRRSDG